MYDITDYSRAIDLAQAASLATGTMFHGGVFLREPTEQPFLQNIGDDETNWSNQLQLWLTPWGFLAGAERYGAEAGTATMGGTEYTTLTWMSPETMVSPSGMRYTVTGYVNAQNLIERVATAVEHPIAGDLTEVAIYSNYQDMDGVMVPATIEQQTAGGTSFTVSVDSATANPADLAARLTPPPPPGGPNPFDGLFGPVGDASLEEIYDGVYLFGGGYVAMIVEFTDFVVVFEGGGQDPARGETVLAAVREGFPDKEIRYMVNSHFHGDHSGGLAPWAREGITILTHEDNVAFMTQLLSNPRTLLGEPTATPVIEGMDDMMVIEDEMNRMEIVQVPNPHALSLLGVYLPEYRHFHQADLTLFPSDPTPAHVAFAERVRELGIEFDILTGVHPPATPETGDDVMIALQ
jgi:hypothetical protein